MLIARSHFADLNSAFTFDFWARGKFSQVKTKFSIRKKCLFEKIMISGWKLFDEDEELEEKSVHVTMLIQLLNRFQK